MLGLLGLLASCAAIGGGRELATYDLSAPKEMDGVSGRSNAQILISEPTALKSLDSERIVVRPNATEITYFGDSQWSDRLPRMVQQKLIETFENSGRIRSVAKPGDGVVVDYNIVTSIRAFELDDEGQDSAKVSLSIKIINDSTGRVRASELFSATAPANLNNSRDAVNALDTALDSVLRQVLDWTLRVI